MLMQFRFLAGVPMEKAVGSRTSVHVGSITREYESLFARDPQLHAKYLATGTGPSMLANRLSWFYDFHGPSVTLETACSSSLYAFHLAVQALRSGESDMVRDCTSLLEHVIDQQEGHCCRLELDGKS